MADNISYIELLDHVGKYTRLHRFGRAKTFKEVYERLAGDTSSVPTDTWECEYCGGRFKLSRMPNICENCGSRMFKRKVV